MVTKVDFDFIKEVPQGKPVNNLSELSGLSVFEIINYQKVFVVSEETDYYYDSGATSGDVKANGDGYWKITVSSTDAVPISVFTGYTANTNITINEIQNDILYLSGITSGLTGNYVELSDFTGYTANTSITINNIENDVNYISGVTDTKLNVNIFTGYTANTQPILDGALTGLTNIGSGTTIGTLSGKTVFLNTISGISINIFENNGVLVFSADTGGGIATITGATNGLNINPIKQVGLGGTLTGDTIINTNNFSVGFIGNSISGPFGFTGGSFGLNSFAFGLARAEGNYSFASGKRSCAIGLLSHAEGYYNSAIGTYSHAEGYFTCALGFISHTEGGFTFSDKGGHAEGSQTCALGYYSHSQNQRTIAIGCHSHAGGSGRSPFEKQIFACGFASFNHSRNTTAQIHGHGANANYSAILGGINHNIASGNTRAAIIGGNAIKLTGTTYIDTTAVANLAIFETPSTYEGEVLTWNPSTKKVTKSSLNSLAGITGATNGLSINSIKQVGLGGSLTGNTCVNTGNFGIVFGKYSYGTGSNSFAEGRYTYAIGNQSHAEGYATCAYGNQSHAEGGFTYARGCFSHAEGYNTVAFGNYSHSEGRYTSSSGNYSHAGGRGVNFGRRIFASGIAAFNHSEVTGLGGIGDGANADNSAILGGIDHNIATGNTRAAIIGGNAIKLTGTTYIDTTAVANLAIFTTPSTFNGDVLTWNPVNKKVTKLSQNNLLSGYTTLNIFNSYTAETTANINYISGVTDTKLDISDFTGYTANTNITINEIQNDIIYISGVTDTKLDIDTFSGYTGNTTNIDDIIDEGELLGVLGGELTGITISYIESQLPINEIENNIIYLSGITDTKLDKIDFTGYTANTSITINEIQNDILYLSAVTSGLTGNYVELSDFTGYTANTSITINEIENDIIYISGVTDTKLDKIDFTGYTANTSIIINEIQNDIIYMSGITDTKLDKIDFTGYTANTNITINEIENDILYLSGITDSKLDINIFTGYTANTSVIINEIENDILYLSAVTSGLTSGSTGTYVELSDFTGYTANTNVTINEIENDIIYISGITDTKLDKIDFTGYTANTSITINEIENDIIYISGVTDTKLDKIDFTGYTANTSITINEIQNDILYLSGITSGLTGTYVELSDFTGYTANTNVIINEIENDIIYISGITDTKLDISDFTGYTANTTGNNYTFIGSGITDITLSGDSVIIFTPKTTESIILGVSSTEIITTGAKGRKTIGYSGTILSWRLVSDVSTTTTVDIWKANASIPTNSDSITASAKPSLSAAEYNGSSTLTGWNTTINSNDVIIIEVESNDNAKYLSLELLIEKN